MDQTKHGLIIDLNKYRPDRNLKEYLDAGVDGFIFRIGGPEQWIEGNFRYREDPTWRPYMEQADKLGIPRDRIGGYIVHNASEDWRLEHDVHIDLLNQWTSGGYMPGYLMLDHEVNYYYRGSEKIIVTPYNMVNSLQSVMTKMYKKFRKATLLYSARWFYNSAGLAEHTTLLDNVNGPSTGKQWPMVYAWYLTQYATKTYTNLRKAIEDLPIPTGDQVGAYLQCGSYSLWDLWQFTDRLKLGADKQGVDANVTRMPIDEFWKLVGAKVGPVEPLPEPEPQPDPDPVGGAEYVKRTEYDVLLQRIAVMESEIDELRSQAITDITVHRGGL